MAQSQKGRSLIELVCPACRSSLVHTKDGGLACSGCKTDYPKRAAVDVLLSREEWDSCQSKLDREKEALEKYNFARRESPLNIMYNDAWVADMLREIPDGVDGPFLEMMCGGAEICRRLPARFTAALAIDINVGALEQLAQDFEKNAEKRVKVVCTSGLKLPLADQSIGIIVIQGGLHHVRYALDEVLGEIRRVLRPGGIMVASEPANDSWLINKLRAWQYSRSKLQGNDEDEDGFTRQELAEKLPAFGLKLYRYRQFGFLAYPLIGNTDLLPLLSTSRSMGLGRALLAIDRLLEHMPVIRGMGMASIFCAVKENS